MAFFTDTKVIDVVDKKKIPLISVDKTTSVHDTLKVCYCRKIRMLNKRIIFTLP